MSPQTRKVFLALLRGLKQTVSLLEKALKEDDSRR